MLNDSQQKCYRRLATGKKERTRRVRCKLIEADKIRHNQLAAHPSRSIVWLVLAHQAMQRRDGQVFDRISNGNGERQEVGGPSLGASSGQARNIDTYGWLENGR
jgi:hypothetical protein